MPAPIDFMEEHARLKARRAVGETREALIAELEQRLDGLVCTHPGCVPEGGHWHDDDGNDLPEHDVIEDLLDCLGGWCSPHMAL